MPVAVLRSMRESHPGLTCSIMAAGAMAFGELFAGPSSYGDALTSHELSVALRQSID